MQATIVSDTSCLILLEKVEALHLLQLLFGQVYITPEVAAEYGNNLPNWVSIKSPIDNQRQKVLEVAVDKGEASAIALALEQSDCLLIIDDLKGRKLAKRLGINITGTLGVLVQAKQSGHLAAVRPLLEKLQQTDFRLTNQLLEEVLQAAGE